MLGKLFVKQDGNGVLRLTADAVTPACAPALTLIPPNPDTVMTSMVSCVVPVALTMPAFPSDPPFTAAATVSGGVNDALRAEIITALDPATESGAAASTVPLPWLLTSIVGGGCWCHRIGRY